MSYMMNVNVILWYSVSYDSTALRSCPPSPWLWEWRGPALSCSPSWQVSIYPYIFIRDPAHSKRMTSFNRIKHIQHFPTCPKSPSLCNLGACYGDVHPDREKLKSLVAIFYSGQSTTRLWFLNLQTFCLRTFVSADNILFIFPKL